MPGTHPRPNHLTSSSGFQLDGCGGTGRWQRRQRTGSLSPGVSAPPPPCPAPPADRGRAGTEVRIAGVAQGREARDRAQSPGCSQAAGPGRSSGTRGRAPLPHPSPSRARRAGAASRETRGPGTGKLCLRGRKQPSAGRGGVGPERRADSLFWMFLSFRPPLSGLNGQH